MPNTSSYADVVRDWELLLAAANDNLALLGDAEPHRAALEQHLAETKALKARQDSARAARQKATQELDKKLDEGREKAMRFRAAVKANLGPKNEQLVQFGMVPLRKRGPREKPPEVKPPEEVPTPETQPASSSRK